MNLVGLRNLWDSVLSYFGRRFLRLVACSRNPVTRQMVGRAYRGRVEGLSLPAYRTADLFARGFACVQDGNSLIDFTVGPWDHVSGDDFTDSSAGRSAGFD